MTDKEALTAARALIADPERWTTGAYARSAKGWRVKAGGKAAVCWCGIGALQRVTGELTDFDLPGYPYLRIAAHDLFGTGAVHKVNDNRALGHAAVLQVYDRAIAECDQ
jgi:hypothetical protein